MPLDRLRRNLAVLPILSSHGVPVCAPLVGLSGEVVAEVSGNGYCLFPWFDGEHVRGIDLSVPQARGLGAQLARLHTALALAADDAGLPAMPASVTSESTEPERAVQKADRLAGAVSARGAGGGDVRVLFTNARFSRPTLDFAKSQRLHLVDRHLLAQWAIGSHIRCATTHLPSLHHRKDH